MRGKLLCVILLTAVSAWAADTRLADAAQNSDRNLVKSLLAQKVDVNAPQGDGATALHWAAFNDDLETAQLLLAAGANLKAATRVGSITPLFMAAKNGNAAMLELLLKSGADPNSTDEHGTTALMTAAASGNASAVETLIEHGADVNARGRRSRADGADVRRFAEPGGRNQCAVGASRGRRHRHESGEAPQAAAS